MEYNTILKHNGYTGSVEYSTLDECYYGYILNTPDMITYESDTIVGLANNFRVAVDDYIDVQQRHWYNEETVENHFVRSCKGLSVLEKLNWYRNFYHAEPEGTERRIIAETINDLFMQYKDVFRKE